MWKDVLLKLILKDWGGNWHYARYHFGDSGPGTVLGFLI